MKQFLAIGLLLIGVSVVSAQTDEPIAKTKAVCNLTVAQAPVISGVRLGMTPEQGLALFPGSSEETEVRSELSRSATNFGVANIMIKPEKYSSKSAFQGVTYISFKFIDGQLSTFTFGYNGPEWKNVDEFIAKFSEGKNLPAAEAWEAYVGMDTQLKTLKCSGFEINVFTGGTGGNINYVKMVDTAAEQKLKERKAKAREKAAQESKP